MKYKEIDVVKKDQLVMLFNHYHSLIDKVDLNLEIELGDKEHLMNLCKDAVEKYDEFHKLDGDNSKVNRWLGFIQGVLIANGITTVNKERDFTRSYLTKHREDKSKNSNNYRFNNFLNKDGMKSLAEGMNPFALNAKETLSKAQETAERIVSLLPDEAGSLWKSFVLFNKQEAVEVDLKKLKAKINKSKYYDKKVLKLMLDSTMRNQYKKVCFLIEYSKTFKPDGLKQRLDGIVNEMYEVLLSRKNIKMTYEIDGDNEGEVLKFSLPSGTGRIFKKIHTSYVKKELEAVGDKKGMLLQNELIKLKERVSKLWITVKELKIHQTHCN